jgi:hypothetical protein
MENYIEYWKQQQKKKSSTNSVKIGGKGKNYIPTHKNQSILNGEIYVINAR